ncbi:alkene reductase [Prosthecobacter sp.]|uniref:alkene reductase n=1 Tax=Prosthecobacter sp. TaxID=1965333 RepID=UPI0037840FD2
MKTNTLFTPLELGALSLRNRILMAPTTRMRAQMPGNIPWELNATYYRQRASAGLIISEATPVSPHGHGYFQMPGIHTTAQAEGWKLVTSAVHEAGGKIFLQLFHAGRMSHNDFQPNGELPVAPSAISSLGQSPVAPGVLKPCPVPRALETGEIAGVIEEHRRAAELAMVAGFDGVEIHAANGYLLEQFLSDHANVRTDAYGGSLANRARLILEVTEAVASAWQADRVGIRFSPANAHDGIAHTDRFGTYAHVIRELNRFQLAYIHLVEPRVAGNAEVAQFDAALSSRHFKPLITGHTRLISAGGHTLASGAAAVQSGEADAIAWGRQFIANPDLVERFAKNAPLNPYNRETFYGGTEQGYTDYPFLNLTPGRLTQLS